MPPRVAHVFLCDGVPPPGYATKLMLQGRLKRAGKRLNCASTVGARTLRCTGGTRSASCVHIWFANLGGQYIMQTDGATSNIVNLLSHDVKGILTCLVLRQQQQKLNQRMLINFIRGSITVRLTYCFSSLVLFDNFRSFQATFLH